LLKSAASFADILLVKPMEVFIMPAKKPAATPKKRTKTPHLRHQQKVQTAEGWKRSQAKVHQKKAKKK